MGQLELALDQMKLEYKTASRKLPCLQCQRLTVLRWILTVINESDENVSEEYGACLVHRREVHNALRQNLPI